ncbi:unnamed protein product, partial [Effrenium voratum]
MSAMAGASATDVAPKVFSGETEDAREYKRWKTWVSNKLLTLDTKVPEAARGAYVYTLLSGKALESIEHLEPAEYQKKGGEQVIFQILDARFPQKDVSDEMSETLTAVFGLRAQEGESLKVWIARAGELFDSCHQKCKVTFPEEARGWLILNRSGLNEEQKAVVLARSNGSLKREDIGKAMRSCYPDYAVAKRRSVGAGLVESGDLPDDALADDSDPLVEEMEAFLAEFEPASRGEPDEIFDENEVAEALAVSWKDKRKELNKLQRSRRFGAAQDLKRSYRVEIEELKRKTRCHKCQQVGHWSRECKSGKGRGRGGGAASSSKGSESGAAFVQSFEETFVAAVEWSSSGVLYPDETLLELVRRRHQVKSAVSPAQVPLSTMPPCPSSEVLLVSSPGYGVIDSGCGRTIIGQETLRDFKKLWHDHGIPEPAYVAEVNHFKFGNGQRESTDTSVKLPVIIAGRTGIIKAAIVKGAAPLLISRSALQALQAVVNFGTNEMSLFEDQLVVPMTTNAAGQYVINVLDHQLEKPSVPFAEVMMSVKDDHEVEPTVEVVPPAEAIAVPSDAQTSPEVPEIPGVAECWTKIQEISRPIEAMPVHFVRQLASQIRKPEAVMDTLPSYAALKNQCLAVCHDWTCRQEHEVLDDPAPAPVVPEAGPCPLPPVASPPDGQVLVAYYLQKKTSKELPPSGNALRARFPYRKWRLGEGEFCGSYYVQNSNKSISMSQTLFAQKLRIMCLHSKPPSAPAAKAANAPDEFAEFSQHDPNNGVLQNPLTGETLNVWECGAMTDGSKRREDFAGDETPSGIKRQAKPKAKNMSGLGGDRNRGQPSYAMLFDEETQGHLKDLCNFMMHHSADEGISFG